MKRLILICLLLASPAWACNDRSEPMQLAWMGPVIGGGVSAAGGTDVVGKTTDGGSNVGVSTENVRCSGKFQAPHTGTITAIRIRSSNSNTVQDVKVGVYTDSSGPASKVGAETEFANVGTWTVEWHEYSPVSYAVTKDSYYWLCYEISANGSWNIYYDTVTNAMAYQANTYGNAWPDPMTESYSTLKFDIQADLDY